MKERVQSIGRTLSSMVMPNMGAFITWGFFTALFLYPNGWFPSETLSKVTPYMLIFLLPILIAATGGRIYGGARGAVLAATAVLGCIARDFIRWEEELDAQQLQTALSQAGFNVEIPGVSSVIPMLLAAMVVGPLSGLLVKKFDQFVEGHIPAGFEMLVNNFSVGIFGILLTIICFYAIAPINEFLINILTFGVNFLVQNHIIPLVSIFLEPAKVLFLNNAINHGIFTPLGAMDVQETGKSIMYMLESNPGPGLGLLIAYWLFSRDKAAKNSAPGAIIIHFFGGIHEIYFPYILANPIVILGPIIGNLAAITWFTFMNAGLIGPASPGSIVSFIMMSPRDAIWVTIVGVAIAAVISLFVSAPFVRRQKGRSFVSAQEKKDAMKAASKGLANPTSISINKDKISKIIFACDAGMGSSAMGATKFGKRIKEACPAIVVKNSAIDSIPEDANIVVCQSTLAERAYKNLPRGAQLVQLENFLSDPALDNLYETLTSNKDNANTQDEVQDKSDKGKELNNHNKSIAMLETGIKLNQKANKKDQAIQAAGEVLKSMGCVDDNYISAMHDREKEVSTYLGMGIAIPHGTSEAKGNVKKSGICFLQYPEGVSFGDEKAYLVFGIAGVGDDHLDLLAKISEKLEDEEIVEKLKTTTDVQFVLDTFN